MASDAKRSGKTEVLSMRIDPKTRFMLEVLAKARGQSISTVVERAILEVADAAGFGDSDHRRTWRDYWSLSEGVRALKMADDDALYPTYEDECRLAFAKTHWPFFYSSNSFAAPMQCSVDVLWPKIDTYLDIWEKTQGTDYWAAGRAMQTALTAAGFQAPEWPKKTNQPPSGTTQSKKTVSWDAPKGGDLDDEIPF